MMTNDRIQDIYENGAELTTKELGRYLETTIQVNFDPFFTIDVDKWARDAESKVDLIILNSAEAFDWKLEYRGRGTWFLHPWGK